MAAVTQESMPPLTSTTARPPPAGSGGIRRAAHRRVDRAALALEDLHVALVQEELPPRGQHEVPQDVEPRPRLAARGFGETSSRADAIAADPFGERSAHLHGRGPQTREEQRQLVLGEPILETIDEAGEL